MFGVAHEGTVFGSDELSGRAEKDTIVRCEIRLCVCARGPKGPRFNPTLVQ